MYLRIESHFYPSLLGHFPHFFLEVGIPFLRVEIFCLKKYGSFLALERHSETISKVTLCVDLPAFLWAYNQTWKPGGSVLVKKAGAWGYVWITACCG